jgi:hypothetical protein
VIRSLKLPVLNHNNVRQKIAAMKGEASNDELIGYLTFMRDQFASVKYRYKPSVTEALDIYGKRKKIEDTFAREIEDQQARAVYSI